MSTDAHRRARGDRHLAAQRRPRPPPAGRRADSRGVRALVWRQLTSMRTALVLLLLLALGAIPGSVIPQSGVDALKTENWQAAHPHLTPIYEKLGLFSVYHSPWFAAIYLLLMVSLVGCIVPRLFVYWRGYRRQPPPAPRNLTRLPDHASYTTDEEPEAVLEPRRGGACPAATVSRRARPPRRAAGGSPPSAASSARPATCSSTCRCWSCWSASASAACSATRAASSWSSATASPTGSRSTTTSTRARCSTPTRWSRSASRSTTSRCSGSTRGRARDWRVGFQAPHHLPHVLPGRPVDVVGAARLRPAGQPPAHHRRHPDLPDRARLRAGHHGPRRPGSQGLRRPDASSCPRARTSSPSGW